MSILDLQGLGFKEENNGGGNSHGSHTCGGTGISFDSTLSLFC